MRRIRWAPAETIRDYLEQYHPSLTRSSISRLYDAARSLKKFPDRGRVGQAVNTRELVTVPLPYVVVYRVDSDFVHIFRVIHGAEDRQ